MNKQIFERTGEEEISSREAYFQVLGLIQVGFTPRLVGSLLSYDEETARNWYSLTSFPKEIKSYLGLTCSPWNKGLDITNPSVKTYRDKRLETMQKKYPSGIWNEKNHPMKGKKHKLESKEKMRKARFGKTYEEIYGEKEGKEQRVLKRKITKLRWLNGSLKPNPAWNKGLTKETNPSLMKLSLDRRGSGNPLYGKLPWNYKGWNKRGYTKDFVKLAEETRRKVNYICQFCGVKQLDHRRKLDVHHIDGDRKNNSPDNLLPLCQPCHARLHNKLNLWRYKNGELMA